MTQQNEPILPHLGLLVLDVQQAFLKAFPSPETLVARVQFCVETACLFGLPTLFTEQRPEILGSTLEQLGKLQPDAPRIAKTGFSAFTEPAMAEWQKSESIEHLLIAGLETPICVYQTALDAINQDLDVTLLSDATGCRRPQDGRTALDSLRIHGAHILPSETIFYSILRDSTHPRFKEFTQLVKKYSDK